MTTSSPGELTLYSYWRSSAAWRVRAALAFKRIPHATIAINLAEGQQSSLEYKSVNPNALVPSLVLPSGDVITQSTAILELLEELYPEYPLLPKDPIAKAKVRAIMNMIACDIHPIQNLRVLKYAGDDRRADWAKHFITIGFEGLEVVLSKTAGKYSYGDEVTLADFYLVPQVANARRFNVDMARFPTIVALDARLAEHPAIKATHPSVQPDAVPA